MKKVIVTGATGFLGSWLVKELISNNTEVLAVVRPTSANIARIPKHKSVRMLLSEIQDLKNNLKDITGDIDAFYHLAWDGVWGNSRNDYILQQKNVLDTLASIRAASELGCRLWIGVGSQAEYGKSINKISEDAATDPTTMYGAAKLSAYHLSKVFAKVENIRHAWVRVFSVYGPGDSETTMINLCIRKLLSEEKPSLTKCEQLWDYLYIEDAARGLRLLGESNMVSGIYNLGSGEVYQLKEYVEKIRDSIDHKLPLGIGDIPYSNGCLMHLQADISKIMRDTDWTPSICFESGIKRTIQWISENEEYLRG